MLRKYSCIYWMLCEYSCIYQICWTSMHEWNVLLVTNTYPSNTITTSQVAERTITKSIALKY